MTDSTAPTQRPVMRSEELALSFERDGYVVVPFLDADEVEQLLGAYRSWSADGDHNPPGAYNPDFAEFSIVHSRPEVRRQAFELITAVARRAADRLLADYRPLIANFVNKEPGLGLVPLHQNMSVVDEARFQSVSVWIALVDCRPGNGTLEVVPGSHRPFRSPRGVWAYQAFSGIEPDAQDDLLVPLDVPAGSAIILDDALIHYSAPNRSAQDRTAIQLVMVPAEATALSYEVVGEQGGRYDLDVLEVEPAYYWDFWDGRGDRGHARPLRSMAIDTPRIELDELVTGLGIAPDQRRRSLGRIARRWSRRTASRSNGATS